MHVNSAVHPTVTGQHGSCTFLQQVIVHSDHQCKFLVIINENLTWKFTNKIKLAVNRVKLAADALT